MRKGVNKKGLLKENEYKGKNIKKRAVAPFVLFFSVQSTF